MRVTRLITSFFGIGHLRPAPGTWGSLAALPVAWALHVLGGPGLLGLGLIVVIASGWWATHLEIMGKTEKDPSWIVIDEVAGQWVAFLPVSIGAAHVGAPLTALWPGWIVAFAAFRLFDIWKPGPIGWADRRGGAFGVMADDLLAGLAAAVCVVLGAALAHGVPA